MAEPVLKIEVREQDGVLLEVFRENAETDDPDVKEELLVFVMTQEDTILTATCSYPEFLSLIHKL